MDIGEIIEWSRSLSDAVFLRGDPNVDVRVVDVSPAFIATATPYGDLGDVDEAEEAFLSVFRPSTHAEARRVFVPSARERAEKDFPAYFARLFLSCYVAAGNDDTSDEGQFRKRLVEILGRSDPRADYVPSGRDRLPATWRRLSEWLDEVGRERGYRGLRLPTEDEVGHETLIGMSKRLCFPVWSDRHKIGRALSEKGLSADSDHRDLIRGLAPVQRTLSSIGSREFDVFRTLVARGVSPEDSLFWAAIQSIEPGAYAGPQRNTPFAVQMWLDGRGNGRLRLADASSGASAVLEGDLQMDMVLDALVEGRPVPIATQPPPKHFSQGCVALIRGVQSPWLAARGLSEDDPVSLLIRADQRHRLVSLSNEFAATSTPVLLRGSRWDLLRFDESQTREVLEAVARRSRIPFAALNVRSTASVRPFCVEGLRLADGWLYNSRISPVVHSQHPVLFAHLPTDKRVRLIADSGTGTHRLPKSLLAEIPARHSTLTISASDTTTHRSWSLPLSAPGFDEHPPSTQASNLFASPRGQLEAAQPTRPASDAELPDLPRRVRDVIPASTRVVDPKPAVDAETFNDVMDVLIGATHAAPISGLATERVRSLIGSPEMDPRRIERLRRSLILNGHLVRGRYRRTRGVRHWADRPVFRTITTDLERRILVSGAVNRECTSFLQRELQQCGARAVRYSAGDQVGVLHVMGSDLEETLQVLGRAGIVRAPDLVVPTPAAVLRSFPSHLSDWRFASDPEVLGQDGRWIPDRRLGDPEHALRRRGVSFWKARFGHYPIRYGLFGDHRLLWSTEDAGWAKWVWALLGDAEALRWDGSRLLSRQMPPEPIAAVALASGKGFVRFDELERAWILDFDDRHASSLELWFGGQMDHEPDPAVEIWAPRAGRCPPGRMRWHAFAGRYRTLDERGE